MGRTACSFTATFEMKCPLCLVQTGTGQTHSCCYETRPFDPRPGDVYEHADGGSIYVVSRCTAGPKADVIIQRRPFGDKAAFQQRVRLVTFQTIATGLRSARL